MKTSGFHGMRSFLARATVKSASAVFSAICFVIAAWHSLPDLSALLGRPLCLCVTVCSVPEWRGLVCQIWPKWVASYFSESSVSHFWCWKLQAGETEIVGDLNRMTIYLPYERFHLWRVNVCVCAVLQVRKEERFPGFSPWLALKDALNLLFKWGVKSASVCL